MLLNYVLSVNKPLKHTSILHVSGDSHVIYNLHINSPYFLNSQLAVSLQDIQTVIEVILLR